MKNTTKYQVYKYNGTLFAYDKEEALLSKLYKADEEIIEDREFWERHGVTLIDYKGKTYEALEWVGLSKENWRRKAIRDEYLAEYCMDLEVESEMMMADLAWEFGF